MDHRFEFFRSIGDVTVTAYVGWAVLERCTVDRADWNISQIVLAGHHKKSMKDAQVTLAADHPLYQDIMRWLLGPSKRAEIDREWGLYLRRAKADQEEVY